MTEEVGEDTPAQALEVRAQKGSVLSLTIANYLAMAINAATGPVMARVLGPSGRGAVAAISVWDEASSRVFYLGLPDAVGYRAKEGLDEPSALLGTVRRVGLMLFPLALAAGLLVAHWPLGSLDFRSKVLVVVLVAMSPLVNTFGRSCFQLLMVERDMESLRISTLIVNAVGFVVIVVAVIFGALAVWVAALALALGRFAQHGFSWWRAKVKVKGRAKFGPMIAFGVRAIPGSLTDLANNRLDQLFIIPFLGFRQLGFYAVAVTVNFIPFQIGMAISSSAYGQVRLASERGAEGVASRLIRRGVLTTGLAALAVAVATPTVLPWLYGARFRPSVGSTLILLPGTVVWALTLIATQIGNGLNRPQYASIAQLVGVVLTVGGLPLLIPRYGIVGAALVSSVTYVTRALILLVLLRRDGVTGTTPRPSDIVWLNRRVRRILIRPLRLARQGRRLGQPRPLAAQLNGATIVPAVGAARADAVETITTDGRVVTDVQVADVQVPDTHAALLRGASRRERLARRRRRRRRLASLAAVTVAVASTLVLVVVIDPQQMVASWILALVGVGVWIVLGIPAVAFYPRRTGSAGRKRRRATRARGESPDLIDLVGLERTDGKDGGGRRGRDDPEH